MSNQSPYAFTQHELAGPPDPPSGHVWIEATIDLQDACCEVEVAALYNRQNGEPEQVEFPNGEPDNLSDADWQAIYDKLREVGWRAA